MHFLPSPTKHPVRSQPSRSFERLLLYFILLFLSIAAVAQPSIEAGSSSGTPGETVAIPVQLSTPTGAVALQFDLTFNPAALSTGPLASGAALVNHVLDWELIDSDRVRITITTATLEHLGEGALTTVPFLIAADAAPGNEPLVLENVVVSDSVGNRITPVSLESGNIEIVEGTLPVEIPTFDTWAKASLALLLLLLGLAFVRSAPWGSSVLLLLLVPAAMFLASPTRVGAQTLPGDANDDGEVNAADIPVIVDVILERGGAPGDADCNQDSTINILDTVCLVQPGPGNAPPVLNHISDRLLRERQILALTAEASDSDLPNDTLTWSLLIKPVGATIDPDRGTILWVPTGKQLGSHSFTVAVTDAAGDSDQKSFEVSVRRLGRPPVMVEIDDQLVVEETVLNVAASASDPDLPDDTLSFLLPLAPAGMSINSASGAITWTPSSAQVGLHDVTVRVTDAEGLVDFESFIVTVVETNVAPTAIDDVYEARLGETLSIAAPGVLGNDTDVNGDVLTAALGVDVSRGALTLNSDGSLEYLLEPPDRSTPVELEQKCEISIAGGSRYVSRGTIAVGDVDGDGDIELVAAGHVDGRTFQAEVWILNAADCTEQSHINFETMGAAAFDGHLGLIDLDNDGDLEIIGTRERYPDDQGGNPDREHLFALHHDGALVWPTDGGRDGGSETSPILATSITNSPYRESGPTFADLDGDGTVEIVMGFHIGNNFSVFSGLVVYNAEDGTVEWDFLSTERQGGGGSTRVPTVVDLDLDGTMEVVIHNQVVDHLGNLEFALPSQAAVGTTTAGHLVVAAANFDDDPFPELLGRDEDAHYVFEHDGSLKWRQLRENRAETQLTVADFDGDGAVEFTYLTCGDVVFGNCNPFFLEMYDTDGSLLWSHQGQEDFEIANLFREHDNITAFDANRDGAFDLVWRSENPSVEALFIFDGRDGSLLDSVPVGSFSSVQRFVAIADVDKDGHAELITSYTGGIVGQTQVWGGTALNPLPSAPAFRNQWMFSEAYTDSMGHTFPPNPLPHWLAPGLNGNLLLRPEPDPLIGTTQSFSYRASDGLLDSELATVTLDILPAGNPPRFLSEPDTLTTRGFQYDYAPIVVDPDLGDAVTFELTARPDGMTIDQNTGRVRWAPETNGDFEVTILALDTIGFAAKQSYTLTVGDPVNVPDVVGETEADAETALSAANLLVGAKRSSNHPTVPTGSISAQTPIAGSVAEFGAEVDLVVSLGPAPEDIDDDSDGFTENQGDCDDANKQVFPGATDPIGDGIDQDCDGLDGSQPPTEIVIEPASLALLEGESRQLLAYAIFADGTSQLATSIVSWTSSNPATASVSPSGRLTAESIAGPATITATRGSIVGTSTVDVTLIDDTDDDAPTVEITTPFDTESVFEAIDVVGTADDPNLVRYELAISPSNEEAFSVLEVGTNPVTDGILGQLDPTQMLNGLYTLRLTVLDAGGNQTEDLVTVVIDGQQKVGHLTLTLDDLTVPVGGIPITIHRKYDSRDLRRGDFGIGWRLGISSIEILTSGELGSGWTVLKSGLTFLLTPTAAHAVAVRLPSGRLEVFDLVISPSVSPFVPFSFAIASLQPRAGTRGTLAFLDNPNLIILGSQPGEVLLVEDTGFELFDPVRYSYVDDRGNEFILSTETGLERVTEPNGNELVIDLDGVRHSSGREVTLQRDSLGRISALTEPNGNVQTYHYDGNGDLVRHVNGAGEETGLRYNRNHRLLRMLGPDGDVLFDNEYDEDGRVVRQTRGEGHSTTHDYDLSGRRHTVTDPEGGTTVIEYDIFGNVVSTTNPLGQTWTLEHNSAGFLERKTDPLGKVTQYVVDEQGNQTQVTTPVGDIYTSTYDAGNRLTSITNPAGTTTNFEYDSRGNLIRTTRPDGSSEEFAYDAAGNKLSARDALGNTTLYSYDGFGRLLATDLPEGLSYSRTLDENGNVLTETSTRTLPDGTVESALATNEYDGANRLTSITRPDGFQTSVLSFDKGQPAAIQTSLGQVNELEYDRDGQLDRFVFRNGSDATYEYDSRGFKTSSTARTGAVVARTYDAAGLPATVTKSDGGTESFVWDGVGRLSNWENSRGAQTSLSVDDLGRLTTVERHDGTTTEVTYGELGNYESIEDPLGRVTQQEVDEVGRAVAITHPDGSRDENEFDEIGNLVLQRNPLGSEWQFDYDRQGGLVGVTNPLGSETTYAYDEPGNMISVTDAAGSTTRWEYDTNGQRTKRILPLTQSMSWEFDSGGRLSSFENARGQQVSYAYDISGLLTRMDLSDGTFEAYTYTEGARLATITTPLGTTTLTYDSADRLVERTDFSGRTVRFGYDSRGNRTSVETPLGTTLYSYDLLDRLSAVTDIDGGVTNYTWDDADQLVEMQHANGIRELRTYSDRGRIQSIELRNAANTLLESWTYEHDAAARVTAITELNGRRIEYSYDAADQLTMERVIDVTTTETEYTYDEVGNRLSKVEDGVTTLYQYDANNRLISDGKASYVYDGDGNMVRRTSVGRTEVYGYDPLSRLTSINVTEGGSTTEIRYSYVNSARVRRTIDDVSTDYLIDSSRLLPRTLSEIDPLDGSVEANYTYGLLRLSQTRGGQKSYYHHDEIGSLRRLTGAAGTVTDELDYSAFGETLGRSGSTKVRYGFAGMRIEDVAETYDFRARELFPEAGRFLQLDPLQGEPRRPLTNNGYNYVANNPLNNIDPTGKFNLSLPELNLTNAIIFTIGAATVGSFVGIATGTHPFMWGKSADAELGSAFSGNWFQSSAGVDGGFGTVGVGKRLAVSGAWGAPVALRHVQTTVSLTVLNGDTVGSGVRRIESRNLWQLQKVGSGLSGSQAFIHFMAEVLGSKVSVTEPSLGISVAVGFSFLAFDKKDLAWLSAGGGVGLDFGNAIGIGLGSEIAVNCPQIGKRFSFGPAFSIGGTAGISIGGDGKKDVSIDATVTWSEPYDHSVSGWCSP